MTSVIGMRVRLITSSSRKHRVGPAYALPARAPSACSFASPSTEQGWRSRVALARSVARMPREKNVLLRNRQNAARRTVTSGKDYPWKSAYDWGGGGACSGVYW
jgi:hypothetical protein